MLLNAGIHWCRRYGPTLAGLPPIYIQAGRAEILYDSILAFADRAQKQGADVVLETWEDMNHDFQMFGLDSPQSAEALRRIGQVIEERVCVRKGCLRPNAIAKCSSESMEQCSNQFDFDFIVIGSGFGGSVSAHRLVEKGYRVAVMEMGRRWTPDSLPRTSWSIHRWFWRPKLGLRGFFNMRFFRHATIFHGCAVGGGSITYASTLLAPPEKVWEAGCWTGLADWKAEMPKHYETAARMLGVTENRILGPADYLLKKAAEVAGVWAYFLLYEGGHLPACGRRAR